MAVKTNILHGTFNFLRRGAADTHHVSTPPAGGRFRVSKALTMVWYLPFPRAMFRASTSKFELPCLAMASKGKFPAHKGVATHARVSGSRALLIDFITRPPYRSRDLPIWGQLTRVLG